MNRRSLRLNHGLLRFLYLQEMLLLRCLVFRGGPVKVSQGRFSCADHLMQVQSLFLRVLNRGVQLQRCRVSVVNGLRQVFTPIGKKLVG